MSYYHRQVGAVPLPRSPGSTYENPVMKLSIITPDDSLEEPATHPDKTQKNDYVDGFSVGDVVSGNTIDKYGNEHIVGTITKIIYNEQGDGMRVVVREKDSGKQFILDASTIVEYDQTKDYDFDYNIPRQNESKKYIVSYEQFICLDH